MANSIRVPFRLNETQSQLERKGKKRSSIMVDWANPAFEGGRFYYSTGILVTPKQWNVEFCRVNKTRSISFSKINDQLDRIEENIQQLFEDMNAKGVKLINKAEFRKRLKQSLHITPADEETGTLNLIGFIENRLNENPMVYIKSKGKSKVLDKVTITAKNQVLNHLKAYAEFLSKKGKPEPNFENFDIEIYWDFIKFLATKQKLKSSSRGKVIKDLKSFLRLAEKTGKFNVNPAYRTHDEFRTERTKDTPKLTWRIEEIQKLYQFDFGDKKHFERVRDIFCVGCWTGFRYSDLVNRLTSGSIQGNYIILGDSQKGENRVTLPLHPLVSVILNKYGGRLPKLSNQKANKHLKDLLKISGHYKEVKWIERDEFTGEDVEMVKTPSIHDARRTFATNLYREGYPTLSIMRITGHRSESSFLKYIDIQDQEAADKLAESKVFQVVMKAV